MRICVDVRMLKFSGIGKVIENLLTRLIHKKSDWEFFLIGKNEDIVEFSFYNNENIHIIECNCPIYSIKEQFLIPILIPENIDVFWSPHYNVPVFYKGRLLVTIHDLAHLALTDINKSFIRRLYANTMIRLAVIKASTIVCVSNFTKEELIKYIPNVNKEKITVIYNGVDDKWKNIKNKQSLHDKPYYVYVGNIKPHKNLHRLIEAYKLVKNKIKQDLILIGKKEGFITGENNIAEMIKGYEDRIFFTGFISDELLMQYIVNADAMVFPSLYEGFGLPPIEALAAGKPVIASKASSIPEICEDYVTYFVTAK